MNITKQRLIEDLRNLGLDRGHSVLVHSSLSRIGWVEGGADTVIDALLETVGKGGTVLVPTLSGSPEDSPENPPAFDARETPTWCGRIPETFRRRPEAIRSLHCTHSVAAIGHEATILAKRHEKADVPTGNGTPFVRLALAHGRILLLGVDHNRNTTFHSAEEIAGMPYVFHPGYAQSTLRDAEGREVPYRTRIHRWDVPRDFERVSQALIDAGIVRMGQVGNAPSRLVDSHALIGFLLDLLARDPEALLYKQA